MIIVQLTRAGKESTEKKKNVPQNTNLSVTSGRRLVPVLAPNVTSDYFAAAGNSVETGGFARVVEITE